MRKILLAFMVVCPGWIFAQTANTTVADTLTNPNGSHPSGTITLKSQRVQNDANPRQYVGPATTPVTVTNGAFSVSLFPNTVSLPSGTCFSAAYNVGGQNYTRYWTVPVSATPVTLQQVESTIPCGQQQASSVAPGQIVAGAAGVSQVLTSSPAGFVSWVTGGGGGGGNPGGTNGQLQFNSLGSFGGFTLGGDCTVAQPNITCTKTGGVTFATSATTDTTNAANISAGVLPPARGGTGAGQFSQNSVPFAGASGVYQQNNAALAFDPTLFILKVAGTGSSGGYLGIDNVAGGHQSAISLRDAGVEKFQIGKQTTNEFFIYDDANSRDTLTIAGGHINLTPSGGNTLVGGVTDSNYRFQVKSNGSSGTAQFNNSTGFTSVAFKAGGVQSTNNLQEFVDASANLLGGVDQNGEVFLTNGSGAFLSQSLAGVGFAVSSAARYNFSSTTQSSGVADLGLSRISAGLLGVGNGTQGSFAGSIKLANITLTGTGFTGGGTVNLCVDNAGAMTTSGCTGGGGSGTVTHTPGPLNSGFLMVGNGGNDSNVLGSSGTATTLLHGNAGGNPAFAAVSLTADVSGILPFANGGLGTGTNFTNHFFYGNISGGTAAPIAVQPTWADLAAGTVLTKATFTGGLLFCAGVNAQTGTSYTIATTDECKLTTFNNGSAVAVTLPQATTSGFTAGAFFDTYNIGAGAVTVTPTTSTINGGATIVLNQGQGAHIVSDGTNYSAWVSAAPSGSGTVTSVATSGPITGGTITATGTVGCATCVTSAAALTANQLVIGGGSQASAGLGSLGTNVTVLHGNAGGVPAFSAVSLTADVTGVLPTANIAVALANQTSINGLSITASTGTLAIANGKVLTISNTHTETSTDGATIAFGAGGTVPYIATGNIFTARQSITATSAVADAGLFIGMDGQTRVIAGTDAVAFQTVVANSASFPRIWAENIVAVKSSTAATNFTVASEANISNNTAETGQPLTNTSLMGYFASYIGGSNSASCGLCVGGSGASSTRGWLNGAWIDGVTTTGKGIVLDDDVSGNLGMGTGIDTTRITVGFATAFINTITGQWTENGSTSALALYGYGTAKNTSLSGLAARGTQSSPTASQTNDIFNSLEGRGYGTTGFASGYRARVTLRAAENQTDSAQGAYIAFEATPTGSTTAAERFRVDSTGISTQGTISTGIAGTSTGALKVAGVTSGVVTIQAASAAGTWSMTLPTSAGTNTYALTTNGSGVTTWSPVGTGTVTVVSAGSLTSTALVTGGGSQALQTPSATATMDSSGNISTPGTVSSGVGSGIAGADDFGSGTSASVPANSFGWGAGTTMTTSVRLESPNAVPAANNVMLFGAPSSNKATWAWTGISGSGSFAMTTSPTFVTPVLGTVAAGSILTNATGLPIGGLTGLGTGVGTALGTAVSGSGAICLVTGSSCVVAGGGTVVPKTANYTILNTEGGKIFPFKNTTLTATLVATVPTMPFIIGLRNLDSTNLTVARNGNTINRGTSDIVVPAFQEISCEADTVTANEYGCTTPLIGSSTITITGSAIAQTFSIPSSVPLAGSPTTTTQSASDNSTKIATTAYVDTKPVSVVDLTTGTSKTFSLNTQVFECTGTCTITMPVPAAGKQFCVRNANNVSTVITFAAIGSSSMYENTASTAYGTAGTGTLVSGGAVGDKVCLVGKDSTHYDIFSYTGTWVVN